MSAMTMTPDVLAKLADKDFLAAFQARFIADPEDATRIETVWERALRTGSTPGKITGSSVKPKTLNTGSGNLPSSPPTLAIVWPKCPNLRWFYRLNPYGLVSKVPRACRKPTCPACRDNSISDKQRRYHAGAAEKVVTISWTGAAGVDEAREWTKKFANRFRDLPPRISIVSQDGMIELIFADVFTAKQTAQVARYTGSDVVERQRHEVKIADYVDTLGVQGEQEHVAVRFSKGWPTIADPPEDYALGDAVEMDPEDPEIPADGRPELSADTAMERKTVRGGKIPRAIERRRDEYRRRNIWEWIYNWRQMGPLTRLAIQMSVDARIADPTAKPSEGGGIKRLVRDYADAMAGRRPWFTGYEYITDYLQDRRRCSCGELMLPDETDRCARCEEPIS